MTNLLDIYPALKQVSSTTYTGRIRGSDVDVEVEETAIGYVMSIYYRNGHLKKEFYTNESVFSTRWVENMLNSNEECFVPLSDYNRLKAEYIRLKDRSK